MKFKILLLATFLLNKSAWATKISLSEALAKGLVTAEIRGKKYNELGLDTNAYQRSMFIQLNNNTANYLEIKVENGRILDSEESNRQDMMVVQEEVFVLKAKSSQQKTLYAMCIQKNNSGPGSEFKYKLGNMANSDLQSISRFIQDKKYFNYGAQNAVWCISDNMSVLHIYADNATMEDELISKVCSIKKIAKPDVKKLRTQFNSSGGTRNFIIVKKHKYRFNYSLDKASDVKIALYDTTDKEVRVLKNNIKKPDGIYELDITFNNVGLPDSLYTIKLLINNEVRKKAVVNNR